MLSAPRVFRMFSTLNANAQWKDVVWQGKAAIEYARSLKLDRRAFGTTGTFCNWVIDKRRSQRSSTSAARTTDAVSKVGRRSGAQRSCTSEHKGGFAAGRATEWMKIAVKRGGDVVRLRTPRIERESVGQQWGSSQVMSLTVTYCVQWKLSFLKASPLAR